MYQVPSSVRFAPPASELARPRTKSAKLHPLGEHAIGIGDGVDRAQVIAEKDEKPIAAV
jgi:hypothetical protein